MPLVNWDGTNPAQLSSILTTTFQRSRADIVDNVFTNNPLWQWLRVHGMVEHYDGGESIWIPLIYSANQAVTSFQGYQLLPTDPQEGLTAATYVWKQYAVPITISGLEKLKNAGQSALIRLLEARRVQASRSLAGRLNYDAIHGSVSDPTRLTGLAEICQEAAQGNQTRAVGNILASTYPWWANQFDGAENAKWTSATDPTIHHLVSMYAKCTDGADHPDLILCDDASLQCYEKYAIESKSFTNTAFADFGFQNFQFKGAVMVSDKTIPTVGGGKMYFLNSNYLILVVHSACDMAIKPFQEPPNQYAQIGFILWAGEFCCSNRSKQGVVKRTNVWS